MKQKKEMVKLIFGISLLVLVAVGLFLTYQAFGPKKNQEEAKNNTSTELTAENSENDTATQSKEKEVVIEVVIPEQEAQEYTMTTKADTLRQALEENNLIAGSESEFGFYITEVADRIADESKQEWWCITKGGEEVFYGVNDILIQDGEQYELTLKIGY